MQIRVNANTGNAAPVVSLTAPASGASFTAPAAITLSASASDADGTISRVEFYNGATLLSTDASSPYSFAWNNVAAGTYSITARAVDNRGAATSTAVLSVQVRSVIVSSDPIVGNGCGANGKTLEFEFNTNMRSDVGSYTWWYSGSDATISSLPGSQYKISVTFGNYFAAGKICVGTSISQDPYYRSYCKDVSACTAREGDSEDMNLAAQDLASVGPNPFKGSLDLQLNKEVSVIFLHD
ncbi:MAG: Ig-like domain-containing protein, partial [Cytophagaceae bacterium]|nr:Ig-like domain-containing protein [Cytophagaceae bacterium]